MVVHTHLLKKKPWLTTVFCKYLATEYSLPFIQLRLLAADDVENQSTELGLDPIRE